MLTLSARAARVAGISSPIALAVSGIFLLEGLDTRMVDLPVRAKSTARQATGLQGGSIGAGLKLQDCFSAPNSEVVFAIKKPLGHLN
jgi:hypothetical protein